jgi:Zn-dependent M28 family amino/carboxypeptidase
MKNFFWLALVVLFAVVAVGSSGFWVRQNPQEVLTSALENAPADNSQKLSSQKQKINIGQASIGQVFIGEVSGDKLFSHVQKLSGQRYTDEERLRTRNYIINELKKLGWKTQLEKFPEGVNVFAEREGTDKTAGSILISAHYDTVFSSPGADDNTTGIAVTLEVARLFASRSTPRTLQLIFFDKEEAGLLGSQAFVKNKIHLEKLYGVINMDMVGFACYAVGCQKYPAGLPVTPPSDKGDFLVAVGDAEHLPLLDAFNNQQKVNSVNLPVVFTLPVPLKGSLIPDTLRSDHAAFWLQGIGAVFVTDTANLRSPHYHQKSDKPATIDRNFFVGAAQIVINATTSLLETE